MECPSELSKNNVIFDKSWVRDKEFNRSDVKGNLHVVYQNGLYIDKSNLKPRLENRIHQLALLSADNGILHAATAFGKTVVCCHLITKSNTSTMILVQQTTLMEQWQKSIERFVTINELLPTNQTPKGFIKTRKS